eukprot:735406_1
MMYNFKLLLKTATTQKDQNTQTMASQINNNKFNFYLDRGGTFTDLFAELPSEYHKAFGPYYVTKLLSVNPGSYPDAPREGIRRILETITGVKYPANKPLDSSRIGFIRMGTTVATNALLERNGEPTALLITAGFRDVLHIGNQSRPKIFDLKIDRPDVIYKSVYEINERVRMARFLSKEEAKQNENTERIVKGLTNEDIYIETPLDEEQVRDTLQQIHKSGIKSIAVVFMHSYTYNKHEQIVKDIATQMHCFANITISSDTIAMKKLVPRGQTTCADAYLTPCIRQYVDTFSKGFDKDFKANCRVTFMQSDGGLCSMDHFNGYKAVLSGPAGGVVGYVHTTYQYFNKRAIIGFDMGGTSTDVSRYDGEFEHVFENVTAGVCIQAPQLDINTVAAGGGSILAFEAGMMHVGPESARAYPGPVCYLNNGPLAITDANLVTGRIIPSFFPKIFGPNKDQELGMAQTKAAFRVMTDKINEYNLQVNKNNTKKTIPEVALGFIKIANESMCRPIRNLTMARGYDIVSHVLACFGGAGGQHACAIARSLGIHKVFIHKFSGILSAYGMGLADVVQEEQEACSTDFKSESMSFLQTRLYETAKLATSALIKEGHDQSTISVTPYLNLRFVGTDTARFISGNVMQCTALMKGEEKEMDLNDVYKSYYNHFISRYKGEFGFVLERDIICDDVRCRAISRGRSVSDHKIRRRAKTKSLSDSLLLPSWNAWFDVGGVIRRMNTAVYDISDLYCGDVVKGPALILQKQSTIVIEPKCTASITEEGNICITVGDTEPLPVTTELDNIQLAIFGHRFMSIAEQMGRALQRTSVSTNIKERLDFSCAIFGATGQLVANAPHIPVHLGSMQDAVKYQVNLLGDTIKDGDVLVSNHPKSGGTHLPDITVITPVFVNRKAVFWLASRGHHADIGGIAPGSMPPFSKLLSEEGCAIESFCLVQNGAFQEEGITKLLNDAGTRNLGDNLSDLRAQIAANNKGKELMASLIGEYSLIVVQAYMAHIQDNAEVAVRQMLRKIHERYGTTLYARDYMDDGTPIVVTISIDGSDGSAVFDFTGTGPMVYGNCNAPPAVTYSAIIYCMRCLVELDIPLNQGCLAPITVVIPKNSILNPSVEAAVVGGNVLTSQRVTDVILGAFGAVAASQGCMNNLTFGDRSFGYYETIAGGSGAGASWNGQSGVHTHMTNTRITDAEIFERRYPAVLRRFSLRLNSGGKGRFNGGDGCLRFIQFTRPLLVSILSERRSFEPYGLEGGGNAKMGRNIIKRKRDGVELNIGSKRTYQTESGDMLKVYTPGGGGWGKSDNSIMI